MLKSQKKFLFDLIHGDNNSILQTISWPTTGAWCSFVQDIDGSDIWNSQNIVLCATNRNNSEDVLLLPVRLQVGFTTDVLNQPEIPKISELFFYPDFVTKFTRFWVDFVTKINNICWVLLRRIN